MKTRHALWAIIVLQAFFLGESEVAAQPPCTVEEAMRQPSVQSALDEWQAQNRGWIEPSVRTDLALDFCNAAATIRSEKTFPTPLIAPAAAETFQRFLRPFLDDGPGQSMIGALLEALGRASGGQPVPRRLGTIRFTYLRQVDALSVRGSSISPVLTVIVAPGSASYAGYLRRRLRCSGTVEVVAARIIQVSC